MQRSRFLPLVFLLTACALPAAVLAQQPDSTRRAALLAEAKPSAGSVGTPAPAQPRMLAGNVVDEWGKPLQGATVMVLGDKMHSVSTNSEGNFLLPTVVPAPVVQISFAGYQEAERVVRGPADLLFKLDPIEGYKRDLKKRSKAAVKAWKH